MRVLLTNDDGVHSPGLQVLREALLTGHDCLVSAPLRERSGASHTLTMLEPIRTRTTGSAQWAVDGSPVDCVYLALHEFLESPPDFVISGINKGANLGDDVYYSGTVGAAREACLCGLPAMAVSLDTEPWIVGSEAGRSHWETAVALALRVMAAAVADPLPEGVFLNLNVPNRPLEDLPDVQICRLGRRHYEPVVERRVDPRGKDYYWIGGEPVGETMGEGTDGWYGARGYPTLTPMGLDTSAHAVFDHCTRWGLGG